MGVLEKAANEARTPLQKIKEPLRGYSLALPGTFQWWNAALAMEALVLARIPLTADCVRHGLATVSWPGRFEEIISNVILDGAHNPHSARILAETWNELRPGKKATLVFSAVSSKDIGGILAHLAPLAARLFICPVDTPRAVPPAEIAAQVPASSATSVRISTSLAEALHAAGPPSEENPVLIAGSLFLVGEARAHYLGGDFQPSLQ